MSINEHQEYVAMAAQRSVQMENLACSTAANLVERFQCPGCVCGSDANCGNYKPDDSAGGVRCAGHILGTHLGLGNLIALGLPKGFCRPGVDFNAKPPRAFHNISIRLWAAGTNPRWNRFNVPVWAMVEDGFMFVRTFAPRVNNSWVDVVEGGTLEMVPNAINVGDFVDEID